jgi:hypothetical protein
MWWHQLKGRHLNAVKKTSLRDDGQLLCGTRFIDSHASTMIGVTTIPPSFGFRYTV